jgi:hypothetical protein
MPFAAVFDFGSVIFQFVDKIVQMASAQMHLFGKFVRFTRFFPLNPVVNVIQAIDSVKMVHNSSKVVGFQVPKKAIFKITKRGTLTVFCSEVLGYPCNK